MKGSEKQGREGELHPIKYRVPKSSRRDKRDFFNEQRLIIQANNKRGKTRDFFRKLETSRENSAQR